MLKSLRKNFITGVAVILPSVITIWLIKFVFDKTNMVFLDPTVKFLKPYIFDSLLLETIAKLLVFVFLIAAVALIGFGTRVLFVKDFFSHMEKRVLRIPMVGWVYGGMKDMSHAFLGQTKGIFTRVVLIEFPHKGIYAIGFVTSEGRGEVQDRTADKVINVFVPTTPNPTSGFLLLVPEKDIISLNMSIDEGLRMVISGGIVSFPDRVKIMKNGDTDN